MFKFILLMLFTMSGVFAAAHSTKKDLPDLTEIILTDDNVISMKSAFTSDSVSELIEQAAKLDSRLPGGQPIYLFLRTPGGSIQAGLELFEYLKGLNRPVHTITLFAASMGFQTVQQLGKRYILENGVLMSHRARGGIDGEFGGGTAQMDTRYGLWLRRIQALDAHTVKRTNGKQTLKSYQAAYANELWLNGKEAVDQGYADAVVKVKCDASLEGKVEKLSMNFIFITIEVTIPKCPLRTRIINTQSNIHTNRGVMKMQDFISINPSFKTCEQIEKENAASLYASKEVVCALDPNLNMTTINNEIKKATDFLIKDLSEHVIRN
jgi:ATP-dependent Clp protease protease subunit